MVKRIPILGLVTLMSLALWSDPLKAATFKCGTEIVRTGMTTMQVLLRCGPPSYKELKRVVTEGSYARQFPHELPHTKGGGYSEVTETVETWYFNCGAHRFVKILTFRAGLLTRVRVGRYGSGESDCIGAERRKEREEARARAEEVRDYTLTKKSDYGRISVFGRPHFAEVYLDGKYVGDLPCSVENVEPGLHDLKVTRSEYKDWEKRITIEPGETLFLEVYLGSP
jgi:hypothetical protein